MIKPGSRGWMGASKGLNARRSRSKQAWKPWVDGLEVRELLAVVTNLNDSGIGSFRDAIIQTNASPSDNVIQFSLTGSGPQVIAVLSGLPQITDTLFIDGIGKNVVIDGAATSDGAAGLTIRTSNCDVRGLTIVNFLSDGIAVINGSDTILRGNFVGINPFTNTAAPNLGAGILVTGDTQGITIGGAADADRNIISGNTGPGVFLVGIASSGTLVDNNFIGVGLTGMSNVPNGGGGLVIDESNGNLIGLIRGNVISGNTGAGITIRNFSNGNELENNFIGTDPTGSFEQPNTGDGVAIIDATNNNIGSGRASRNVISGNLGHGVSITGTGSFGNPIFGNNIGTNFNGDQGIGNGLSGVFVFEAPSPVIGGVTANLSNLISANFEDGVHLQSVFTATIQGNFIGVNAAVNAALGNRRHGIHLEGSSDTLIGGIDSSFSPGNIISGNDQGSGVLIQANSFDNSVLGNLIGTNDLGNLALPNLNGVSILNSPNNSVGVGLGGGNLISGNLASGVLIEGVGAIGNRVQANKIGTDSSGTLSLGNSAPGFSGAGVLISDAKNNLIGGNAFSGAGNLISGNLGIGLLIRGVTSNGPGDPGNLVQGNRIGTDFQGSAALPNQTAGVAVSGARNLIGGLMNGEGNLISGNDGAGLLIETADAIANTIVGNQIGTNAFGNAAVPNLFTGIVVDGAPDTLIGGGIPQARNLVSGNEGAGIVVANIGATNTQILGNFIGTDSTGAIAIPNNGDGVLINQGASLTRVGSGNPDEGNLISGNDGAGVAIENGASNNLVFGNILGTTPDGATPLGNNVGVQIIDAANNQIGNSATSRGNLISGNVFAGIVIQGSSATNNRVQNNRIGTDLLGTAAVPNDLGVLVDSGAFNNLIGGSDSSQGNLISGNTANGVLIANGSSFNTIQNNFIGTTITGFAPLGNQQDGVRIDDSADNLIGNAVDSSQFGNLISGNKTAGIKLNGALATRNVVQGNLIGVARDANTPIPNEGPGVWILDSGGNTIGSSDLFGGNVISGNLAEGVLIEGATSAANFVLHNLIGLTGDGFFALPNSAAGIQIFDAPGTIIGGASSSELNVIAGNDGAGIDINGASASSTQIVGNIIGLNAPGLTAVPNAHGIVIDRAPGTVIGGTASAAGNVISGHGLVGGVGVSIKGDTAVGTTILGNFIGTNATGTQSFPNLYGIEILDASSTIIGGSSPFAGNIISGNDRIGILISGSSTTATVVAGNRIGTNPAGDTLLGNGEDGIVVEGAQFTTIGGSGEDAGNLISANGGFGVVVHAGASVTAVLGNFIGTNAAGASPLPNQLGGVRIDQATDTVLGNNLISGNTGPGVLVTGPSTTNTQILNNRVGVNRVGSAALGNSGQGLYILGAAGVSASDNVFSGNSLAGVLIEAFEATGNLLSGNFIGTNPLGDAPLGNLGAGVAILDAAGNLVGQVGAGNLISGNGGDGVLIQGTGATDNLIVDNRIGTDLGGSFAIANQLSGIRIDQGRSNIVGGANAGNLISGNLLDGVRITDVGGGAVLANVVAGNLIGTTLDGLLALPNRIVGVRVENASGNTIGGSAAGEGNLIAGNLQDGVVIAALMSFEANSNVVRGNTVGLNAANATLPNGSAGLRILAAMSNTVRDNVLSGNAAQGLVIDAAGGTIVKANFLGVARDGVTAVANGGDGVAILNAGSNNTIGETTPGSTNIIAYNRGAGVFVDVGGVGNSIVRDSIFSNGGLGILLAPGVFSPSVPVTITSARVDSAGTTIEGSITAAPNATYRVEFFDNAAADPSGFGEGEIFLGFLDVTTDTTGQANFSFQTPVMVPIGRFITATATNAAKTTSQFSNAQITELGLIFTVLNTNDSGFGSLRQAILNANIAPGVQTIDFAIPGSGIQSIGLLSELPAITEAVIIDARTQPGFNGAPLVEIVGTSAGSNANGFTILAGPSSIDSLVIRSFAAAGVFIQGSGASSILNSTITSNGGDGVRIVNSSNNSIGGTTAGSANTVTLNAGAGVNVADSASLGNSILGNSIVSNGGLGILLAAGVFNPSIPVNLTSALINAGTLTVEGTLTASPNTSYRVEFFDNAAADPSGFGEGQTFIGFLNILTDSSGNASFSFNTTAVTAIDRFITATATNPGNTTSQFSNAQITDPVEFVVTNTNDNGRGSLRRAMTFANRFTGLQTITFAIPGSGVRTITPLSTLPSITEAVIIDAKTQPGFNGAPLVEIVGTSAGSNANGFTILAGPSSIDSLIIRSFAAAGVFIQGSGASSILNSTITSNGGDGVRIVNSSNNSIGGTTAGSANTITLNAGAGVNVADSASLGNSILGNSIVSNGGLGILLAAGVFNPSIPVNLTSALINAGTLTVEGTLTATPNTSYRVEFFDNAAADPSGFGEGQTFIGFLNILTDSSGNASFSFNTTAVTAIDQFITATATNPGNTTSQFSNALASDAISFVVTNTNDSGRGSLRQAILNANAVQGSQTITFAIPGAGVHVIILVSPLPQLIETVVIDGKTQPGFDGRPVVEVDGQLAGANTNGLVISTGAGGTTIRGLGITRFSGNGIVVDGANGNTIVCNSIGVSRPLDPAKGNRLNGILLINSSNNQIGGEAAGLGNLIALNGEDGIRVVNGGGNRIEGNTIGIDGGPPILDGGVPVLSPSFGNGLNGIALIQSINNVIGGSSSSAGNLIIANQQSGVFIGGSNANGNRVLGNTIGLDATGDRAVANHGHGVTILGGNNNFIGGSNAGERNLLSGNDGFGLLIEPESGNGGQGNRILGNRIGTNGTGLKAVGNASGGITLRNVFGNQIGGATAGEGNLITGNDGAGIWLFAQSLMPQGNVIKGNLIGLSATGQNALGDGRSTHGILVENSAATIIGGAAAGERNVITGNPLSGISLVGLGSVGSMIVGNLIGLNAAGTQAIAGTRVGVSIASPGVIVGGNTQGAGNVISGHLVGVSIDPISGFGATIQGNLIGTSSDGSSDLGNREAGILLDGAGVAGSGGSSPSPLRIIGNVISGNGDAFNNGYGIRLIGPAASGAVITGNYVGTNKNGSMAIGNSYVGISLEAGVRNAVIGGATAADRNIVSGNGTLINQGSGILLLGPNTSGNRVLGNLIGTSPSGMSFANNVVGARIENAPGNTIGGPNPADGNVISGNTYVGVMIFGAGATGNTVANNLIGLTIDGTAALGNGFDGVFIQDSSGNTITSNVISGNLNTGLQIFNSVGLSGAASGNVIQGNKIGTDPTGTRAIGNRRAGIYINNAAGTIIGGQLGVTGNVISGNGTSGIQLGGTGATNNQILGNVIGLQANATTNLPNGGFGVAVGTGSRNNVIRGGQGEDRNVIGRNGLGPVRNVNLDVPAPNQPRRARLPRAPRVPARSRTTTTTTVLNSTSAPSAPRLETPRPPDITPPPRAARGFRRV